MSVTHRAYGTPTPTPRDLVTGSRLPLFNRGGLLVISRGDSDFIGGVLSPHNQEGVTPTTVGAA